MLIYKSIVLVTTILVYILIGLAINIFFLFLWPSARLKILSTWTNKFTKLLVKILKLKIIIEGERWLLWERGGFIISNHLGYLDGVVLGSLFPLVYTSKSQVKSWPVFGWMTQVGGTIFIDRQNKSMVTEYIQQTTQVLKQGINVLLFPEGTSSNGKNLLPFQSIHFQSALNAKCKIIPITISYTKIDDSGVNAENQDKLCWYGQVRFQQHLLGVLRLRNIEARVVIHPRVDLAVAANQQYSRKDLGKLLHNAIEQNYPLLVSSDSA